MSSQQSNEEFTSDEMLKFFAYVMRAHQEEYDAYVTVDSDLLSEIIFQESKEEFNLIIEQKDGRTIMRAEKDESE